MPAIVPPVRFAVKQRLLKDLRCCREAGLRLRYLIIINLLGGKRPCAPQPAPKEPALPGRPVPLPLPGRGAPAPPPPRDAGAC